MGAVTFSLDPVLLNCLRDALGLEVFVETGTFEGATAELAAASFAEVHTVELSQEYYRKAQQRLAASNRVHVHQGESTAFLKKLQPSLAQRRVLYWLDAHWCDAGDTAGAESQCPLLEELTALAPLNAESVVLIDDARLFLCPPPGAHRPEQWPALDALVRRLLTLGVDHELVILNDVICLYPAAIEGAVRQLARHHAFDWLKAADKARGYDGMHEAWKRTASEAAEKDTLIAQLHSEAGRLRSALEESTQLVCRLDEQCRALHRRCDQLDHQFQTTMRRPFKLAGLSARALLWKVRKTLSLQRSA